MKIRTIIIIDKEIDDEYLQSTTTNEFARMHDKQLLDGELYVDEYIDLADNITISSFVIGEGELND